MINISEDVIITNDMLYRCYSANLMKFALNQGCKYLLIAIDPNTNKKFWLFHKNVNFLNSLKIWEANSPRRKS
jgi:hypothetical protein